MAIFRIGIEIGGTKLQLALGDDSGKILNRERYEVQPGSGAAGIRSQIAKALPGLIAGRKIAAVGVGFGGPVDWRTGRICRSHQISGWSDFDLSGWLHEQTGAAVRVDNDANAAALGEARRGAGMGRNPVFYVTLGSGVGGGLVVNGQIYHGITPGEAEIGHVRLDRRGTIVEQSCSGWAVDARIRQLQSQPSAGVLARTTVGMRGGEARHLAAALAQHDPAAEQILAKLVEDLAFGLSHVIHLLHPEVIILGGGLAGVGEPLRAGVERSLRRFIMDAFQPGPKICLSALGTDAVPIGALELAAVAAIS
jgi:glucokinase